MARQHCYDWARPAVTTDIAVFARQDGHPVILLIQRKHDPFAGAWALPGGFLDEGETLEACAARELREETGLVAGLLQLFGTYSAPGRDPRGWTVTAAYWTRAEEGSGEAQAGDDAADCRWFALDALPPLAFDHARIVAEAIVATGV
jgi:8-oxo-dGTP diphosphatase